MVDKQTLHPAAGTSPISDQTNGDSQSRLEAAMREVLEALAAHQTYDRKALLQKYEDVAAELADCLNNLDFVQNVAPQLAAEAKADSQPSRPAETHRVTLGDFRILGELGRGGMGVVYEAEQLSLGRRVALKVLPFAAMLDRQQLKRFKNEARAAATLDHPNIVAVHSVGEERGVHYYAMQLVEGQSLAELIGQLCTTHGIKLDEPVGRTGRTITLAKQRPKAHEAEVPSNPEGAAPPRVSPTADTHRDVQAAGSTVPAFDTHEYYRTVARLGMQAALALDHAHQNGILHRDIKPGNLLIDMDGELQVTDFGLARIEADAGMTMTGDLLGTLAYMSPEQALAKRVVIDHRTDIYSLGVTLYELLTLERPYEGDDRQELLKKIAFDEPRRPRQLNSRIPHDLETIVCKAIEKSPDDRYSTAQELADDLQRFLSNEPIVASRPNLPERLRKWSRRNPGLVTGVTAVMSLLLVTAVIAASFVWREKELTQAALTKAEDSAAQSKALVEFFVDDLLGAVEPEEAMGEKVTVEAVVEEAERKIDSELKDQPQLEAAIRRALGKIHLSLGNTAKAETYLLRAREIQQELLGSDDPETLETMSELTGVLLSQNRYQEAQQLTERTLELKRRVLGPEHPDTLTELNSLGVCFFQQESFGQAQELLEKALPALRRVLGADDEETLITQCNLAATLFCRGRYATGRAQLEETIAAAVRKLGDSHPTTLYFKQSLARLLHIFNIDFQQSRRIYDEILAAQRRIHGPIHMTTLVTLKGLVEILIDRDQYDQAAELYGEVYEQVRSELGPEHSRTLWATTQWANILAGQGKSPQAQDLLEGVLESNRRTHGPEHFDTLKSLRALAEFFEGQGQHDTAQPLREQLVEIRRRVYGPENTHDAAYALALSLMHQHKAAEAIDLFEETLTLRKRVLGSEHPDVLETMNGLADSLALQGDYGKSAELHRSVLEARRRTLGPKHRHTLFSLNNLAGVVQSQGNQDEAIELFKEAVSIFQSKLGTEHPLTLTATHNLAAALTNSGNHEEASQLGRKVLEIKRRLFPSDHDETLISIRNMVQILFRQEKYDEAATFARELLESRRRIFGAEDLQIVEATTQLAVLLRSGGKPDEALVLVDDAIEISRRVRGNEHETTLMLMHARALLLKDLKRLDESCQIFNEVIEARRRTLGPDDTSTLFAMRALSGVLIKQGRRREAYDLDQQVGVLRYGAGRWERAAYTFGKALENAEDATSNATSGFYLAKARWQQGNQEAARDAYAEAEKAFSEAEPEAALEQLREEAATLLHINGKTAELLGSQAETTTTETK